MNVHWTDTAQRHLAAIHHYIAQDSPEYAQRTIDQLTRRSQQISSFPQSGRVVPEYQMDQIREVIESSYRIVYFIKPDQIDVLAVIHTARNILPGATDPK